MQGPQISEIEIPAGWAGTAATIAKMQELVSAGKRDWNIRSAATRLSQTCVGHKNYRCWAERLFSFVKHNVQYVPDPIGVEMVCAATRTLKEGAGDCDDMAILFCALCESIGLKTWFKTIKADPARSDEYSHVYAVVEIPKVGRFTADATVPESYLGWEAGQYPSELWPASKE